MAQVEKQTGEAKLTRLQGENCQLELREKFENEAAKNNLERFARAGLIPAVHASF